MKLLIQFPTRNRVSKFFNTFDIYYNLLEDKKNIIFNISCDSDDPDMNNSYVRDKLTTYKIESRIIYNHNKSKIQAVNSGFDDLDYDIILLASDDMIPQVYGYDRIIKENMVKYFSDIDGILWFNDGFRRRSLNTLSILGKKYYDRFGYIYHPDYLSLWADNEFTIVGNLLKRQKYFNKVIIKHCHHSIDNTVLVDSLYKRNDLLHDLDAITFFRRKSINFGL